MSVINKIFDNIASIGSDQCDLTNKNKENIAAASWVMENFTSYNPASCALNLSTNQQNINFQGSPSGGINSDNIDKNSALIFGDTNMRMKGMNQQRLFSTVPYLGRGVSNAALESQLIMGVNNLNKKSLDPNSEVSHIDYSFTPLLPTIESTVNNPANLVEGVAAEGWVRGGVPSRLLNRDEDQ